MVRRFLSCQPSSPKGPVVAVALLAASAAVLGDARAEVPPEERAAALALFDEGRALMDKKDYPAACPKLEQASQLARGLGILFHLADCYEKVGRSASAWVGFREVSSLARSHGQIDRADDAQNRAKALEPKLIKLLVVPPSPAPLGLAIKRNGEPMAQSLWGTPAPIDPGTHTIVAEAPGRERRQVVVEANRPGSEVRVEIPALAAVGSAAPAAPAAPVPPAPHPDAVPDSDWQSPLGITAFALGGAAVLAGGAVAIAAKAKASSADCDADNFCSSQGVDDRSAAMTMGNVATGVMIAGGVIGVAGLVVWLTAPSDEPPSEATRGPRQPTVALGLRPAAGSLVLRF